MTDTLRHIGALGVAAAFVALGTTGLNAQTMEMKGPPVDMIQKLSVEVRAGGSLPASDDGGFREAVEPGGSFGIGASYQVHPRFNLRIDGDVEFLGGDELAATAGATFPDQRLWHYNAGVEVQVLPDIKLPWTLHANLGVGATTLSADEFTVNGQVRDISDTNFALNGAVRAGYRLTGTTDIFLAVQSYRTFVDESDTQGLVALNEAPFAGGRPTQGLMDPYRSAWTFPVQLGVRYNF